MKSAVNLLIVAACVNTLPLTALIFILLKGVGHE